MNNVRVNIRTAINASAIQIERKPNYKGGDDYTIIKNHKWMIDGIVLNNGLYSKEENEKGYKSMDGRLFTASHPTANGKHVLISQQDNPLSNEALAGHYIGASIVNVRKEADAYFEDIEINNRIANAHQDGVELLKWCEQVENGEQVESIHTSTGLLCQRLNIEGESRGKEYSWVATNQKYDHNALLIGQYGAGGDEIALAVNEQGEDIETMTVNFDESILSDESKEVSLFNRFLEFIKNKPTEKVDPMKEKMIAALTKADVKTEGLNDDQIFSEYTKLVSTPKAEKKEEKKEETNIQDTINAAVAEALAAQQTANAQAAKEALVADVIATNKDYTDADKEELMNTSESILNKLVVKKAASIAAPHSQDETKSVESVANMAMPE